MKGFAGRQHGNPGSLRSLAHKVSRLKRGNSEAAWCLMCFILSHPECNKCLLYDSVSVRGVQTGADLSSENEQSCLGHKSQERKVACFEGCIAQEFSGLLFCARHSACPEGFSVKDP
jgi:hypothetical protein